MKKTMMILLLLNFSSVFAITWNSASKPIAVCKPENPNDTLSVCVYKESWTDSADQYVIRWDTEKDCRSEPQYIHQFIGNDIKQTNTKKLYLKETNSFLGLCKDRWLLDLNLETGKAKFSVKNSNCVFLVFNEDPSYAEARVRTTKLECALN